MKNQVPVSSAPQVSTGFSLAQNKSMITTNPLQPAMNRFPMPQQQRPIMPNNQINMQNMPGQPPTAMV